MSTRYSQRTHHPVPAGTVILVKDRGREILSTNYWDSALAEAGAMYCSVNESAVRLLVPRSLEPCIAEMHTGSRVLVTRWLTMPGGAKNVLELRWDDGAEHPFGVQLSAAQVDRQIPVGQVASALECLVYVRGPTGAPLLAGRWLGRLSFGMDLPLPPPTRW